MDKINEEAMPTEHRISPKGSFEMIRKHISVEMRGGENYFTGPWEGGPPFDVELTTLPPGKKNYPYHKHACQWEYYIFLSGTGKFRDENNEWHEIVSGDHFQFATAKAHQIWNDGEVDLIFYVIANNTRVEIAEYPDTGKTLILPDGKLGYLSDAEYYDKEE
ncbi:MAG: cupin domain-containing protein [Verrucomicrobia bacterium]|nr:cupin domain-containing protein [Verrucomicrobiota bacterium]